MNKLENEVRLNLKQSKEIVKIKMEIKQETEKKEMLK